MQAAILRVKLRHLETWIEVRQKHAARYDELLVDSGVQTPMVMPYARHVHHVYAVRVPQRCVLQEALRKREIHTGIHYPIPVHLQKAYVDLEYNSGDFPVSEQVATEVLSLPMYAELASGDIKWVTEVICGERAGREIDG